MNKRIDTIIGKALDQAIPYTWHHLNHVQVDDIMKKFAELLIQECCDQLVKEGNDWEQFSRNPPDGQAHHATGALFAAYRLKEDAVDMLREHFGINNTL